MEIRRDDISILVADDDKHFRSTFRTWLRHAHFKNIEIARDGEETLDLILEKNSTLSSSIGKCLI